MTDDATTASESGTAICPWCSAELPPDAVETCPSCHAKLGGDNDAPGLTSLDSTIDRIARVPVPQRRSRLLAWITGDEGDDPGDSPAAPGSLAPPPPEVRREMLRMELEREVAELQAEVGVLAADARETGAEHEAEVLEAVADNAAQLREEVVADVAPVAPTDAVTAPDASESHPDSSTP